MASIKRRPGSPYWICCYRKANGERTQRSTKQANKDKAWVCLAWAGAELKAGQGTLTEAQARRVISEIVERTVGEPLQFYTAETWLREWVAGKQQTKRWSRITSSFSRGLPKTADARSTQLYSH